MKGTSSFLPTLLAMLLPFVFAATGCATIFGGKTDAMHFDSEPQGATVFMGGKKLGVTPFNVVIEHKSERQVAVFRKQGYAPKEVFLNKTISGPAWLNLFFISTTFGAPSILTDAATGTLMQFSPKSYVIELDKGSADRGRPRGVTPLEYTIAFHDELQKELSSAPGISFQGLCQTYEMSAERCVAFYDELLSQREWLISRPHALAWYRGVNAVAVTQLQ